MAATCQTTLTVTTIFDQMARVGVEQFLLWSVGNGTKVTAVLQVMLFLRLVGGGVLVGFTKPQFAPACVAQIAVPAIPIIIISLDAIIVGVLFILAVSSGMLKGMKGKRSDPRRQQSKALVLSIIGLGLWTMVGPQFWPTG